MRHLFFIIFCFLFFVACGNDSPITQTGPDAGNIKNSSFLIVDVRTAKEYKKDHIVNAIHIPYGDIFQEIGKHAKGKNQEILLY